MNIKIGLKWILLLLLFWTSPVLCQGQDTLHLDFSDTTVYRGTDWNKRFSVTVSAHTPYAATVQFSIQWRAFGLPAVPELRAYYFKLTQIIPLDTPTTDLSHFGTRQIGEGFLRVITRVNSVQPKALFKLVFEAENPEILEKELDRAPFIDIPMQVTALTSHPIEIIAVDDSLQQLVVLGHGGQLMLRTAVWPGDVDNNGQVDQYDMLALGLEIGQSTTKPRPKASIEWTPQAFTQTFSNDQPEMLLRQQTRFSGSDAPVPAADKGTSLCAAQSQCRAVHALPLHGKGANECRGLQSVALTILTSLDPWKLVSRMLFSTPFPP